MAMNGNTMGDEVIAAVQALQNFPGQGETANVIDPRVIRAICTAIVGHIVANADVLPTSHSGPNLNNPEGQPLLVPGLGIVDSLTGACSGESTTGTTSAEQDIAGKGRIV